MGDTIVSHGAAGGGKKAEQQLEPLPTIDLPDPDHAPSVVLAAGTTPPQLAHTTPRAPAVTPPPVAATRAERAEVATTAMRRFRAPGHASAVPAGQRDARTSAEQPAARRPHRAAANPLTRHPVVAMAPITVPDAPAPPQVTAAATESELEAHGAVDASEARHADLVDASANELEAHAATEVSEARHADRGDASASAASSGAEMLEVHGAVDAVEARHADLVDASASAASSGAEMLEAHGAAEAWHADLLEASASAASPGAEMLEAYDAADAAEPRHADLVDASASAALPGAAMLEAHGAAEAVEPRHADLADASASAASPGAEISQATADAMSPAVATDAASAAVASSPPVAIAEPPPPPAGEPSTTSAAPSALALAAALDDVDASPLLDAEVLADPPPPGPSTLSIITSESPGVALAATRSFEIPALTIDPRDAVVREPTVVVDAEIAAQAAPPGRAPALTAIPTPAPAPPTARRAPRTIAARRRWPRDEQPLTAPAHVAGFSPHDLPPLDVLIHRMPGPPVGAHPTWATRRITAPRDLVLPLLVLATMIAALYGIARAMF